MTDTNVSYWEVMDGAIACPNCGDGYLHHGTIHVYNRFREDGDGIESVVEPCSQVNQHIRPSAQIPFRRDSLYIEFRCEVCPVKPVLWIEQHKGNTYMHWTWEP